MNKAISQNVLLMPPPFSDGLNVWSSQNGGPGSATYANSNNAQVLFTDADFEECLEIVTNKSPQKLRYTGQTPTPPGCYLRVTARVKVVSGVMPSFEIAGWPADSSGNFVSGVTEKGPQVAATEYDKIYEVSAIFGSGDRPGVDCVWGLTPVYGHFGLNVVGGANGSSVRIESIHIEDVTSAYLRVMMDWVDVRDFGARGDGVFNNRAAFEAADAAANGREVLVPSGDYFISGSITLNSKFRFEGRIVQSATAGFNLRAGLKFASYLDAFKNEQLAFEKALAALFGGAGHDSLDLEGKEITLTQPVDMRVATGVSSSTLRRVVRNGRLAASVEGNWPRIGVAVTANYTTGESRLRNVTNINSIQPGMLLTGFGVGREVYATSVDTATGDVILSAPLVAVGAQANLFFTRFSYMLDFSQMNFVSNFELSGMEIDGSAVASCVLLPPTGFNLRFYDSWFIRPRDCGITSHGTGDFALTIEHCEFVSREETLPNSARTTVALNCNANDQRIRHNRGARFKHFCVIGGNNTMFHGNHIYQGLDGDSTRDAGIIFTAHKVNATVTGNYIDNCWIEWCGDHAPSNTSGSVYGSMTIDGNLFFAANVPSSFEFIQMRPYAVNQNLVDVSVSNNTFRVTGAPTLQIDGVQPTGTINPTTMKNVVFTGNVFDGVLNQTINPTRVAFTQPPSSPASTWTVPINGNVPFNAFAISADSVIPTTRIQTTVGGTEFSMPWTQGLAGGDQRSINVNWSTPVSGSIVLTARCDTVD